MHHSYPSKPGVEVGSGEHIQWNAILCINTVLFFHCKKSLIAIQWYGDDDDHGDDDDDDHDADDVDDDVDDKDDDVNDVDHDDDDNDIYVNHDADDKGRHKDD